MVFNEYDLGKGKTLIHVCALGLKKDAIKLLCEFGADVNAENEDGTKTYFKYHRSLAIATNDPLFVLGDFRM